MMGKIVNAIGLISTVADSEVIGGTEHINTISSIA